MLGQGWLRCVFRGCCFSSCVRSPFLTLNGVFRAISGGKRGSNGKRGSIQPDATFKAPAKLFLCSQCTSACSHPFSTPPCAFLMKCMALHTWPHMHSAMYIHTEPPRARSRHPATTPHSPIWAGVGWLSFKTLHVSEKGVGPLRCCAVSWQNADARGSSGISLVLSSPVHSEGA